MPAYRSFLRLPVYGVVVTLSSATLAAPPVHDEQHALHISQTPPAVLNYESAMETYKPYSDQPVQSWQEANELVGNIGGWRTYLREAAAGADASETDASSSHHEHHHGEVQP